MNAVKDYWRMKEHEGLSDADLGRIIATEGILAAILNELHKTFGVSVQDILFPTDQNEPSIVGTTEADAMVGDEAQLGFVGVYHRLRLILDFDSDIRLP